MAIVEAGTDLQRSVNRIGNTVGSRRQPASLAKYQRYIAQSRKSFIIIVLRLASGFAIGKQNFPFNLHHAFGIP